jgi:hypothetical protein
MLGCLRRTAFLLLRKETLRMRFPTGANGWNPPPWRLEHGFISEFPQMFWETEKPPSSANAPDGGFMKFTSARLSFSSAWLNEIHKPDFSRR